jgi:hypothetical protein
MLTPFNAPDVPFNDPATGFNGSPYPAASSAAGTGGGWGPQTFPAGRKAEPRPAVLIHLPRPRPRRLGAAGVPGAEAFGTPRVTVRLSAAAAANAGAISRPTARDLSEEYWLLGLGGDMADLGL